MAEDYSDFVNGKLGVLIVDDSSRVRAILGQRLRNRGFDVHLASCGPEAVSVYRQATIIDLVLIDASMPGMDGPATLTALRGVNPGVRACFLAEDGIHGHVAGYSSDLGDVRVLSKSMGLPDLDRIVSELLEPAETGEWSVSW